MTKVTTLRDDTRAALENRPRWLTLNTIAEETGLTLRWLQAFACGQANNPGVVSVETLLVYLNKKQGK